MSSVPAVTVEKKESLSWSIVLSILLIVAGFLAITLPQIAGIAVNLMVGWLLIFSGAVHIVYSWQTRSSGGLVWGILLGLVYALIGGYLLAYPVLGLVSLTLGLAFYLFAEAVLELVMSIPASVGAGFRLVALGRNRYADSRRHDLEDMAVERGLGARYACGNQHGVQWNLSLDDFSGGAPGSPTMPHSL